MVSYGPSATENFLGETCAILDEHVIPSMLPPKGGDWTHWERDYIGRLGTACRCTLECSLSDEGEPWCTVYDECDHTIFTHIARINRRYVVAWPQRNRSVNTSSINAAVDLALREMTHQRAPGKA